MTPDADRFRYYFITGTLLRLLATLTRIYTGKGHVCVQITSGAGSEKAIGAIRHPVSNAFASTHRLKVSGLPSLRRLR